MKPRNGVVCESVLQMLKHLRASGEYSDLIVTCGSQEYRVHQAIMCTRSSFFASALKFPGKEAQERKICLPHDEPDIIELVIQYIYEGDYGPLPGYTRNLTRPSGASPNNFFPHTCDYVPAAKYYCDENCLYPHHDCANGCPRGSFTCRNFICKKCCPTHKKPASLLIHAKMYTVGDKYSVSGPKEVARKKFEIACRFHWNELHFFDAAYFAFTNTREDDKGLRDVVCGTICDRLSLTEEPQFDELREDIDDLGYALFQHLVRKGKQKRKAHNTKRGEIPYDFRTTMFRV